MVATGNWSINVASSITEAGTNYSQTIESLNNQTQLTHSVGGSGSNQNFTQWQVSVQRTSTSWHPSLVLNVRRVPGGSFQGNATLNGGLTYQPITTTPTVLYSGNGNMTGIPIQYQLSGLSVLIPVASYSTTITYTLTSL